MAESERTEKLLSRMSEAQSRIPKKLEELKKYNGREENGEVEEGIYSNAHLKSLGITGRFSNGVYTPSWKIAKEREEQIRKRRSI